MKERLFSRRVIPDYRVETAARALGRPNSIPAGTGHRVQSLSVPQVASVLDFPGTYPGVSGLEDPCYWLTSDLRIKEGRITTRGCALAEGYPVKMPQPAQYTKAMFLLSLRDIARQATYTHWEVALNYLLGDVMEGEENQLSGSRISEGRSASTWD
ncbi:uncharacterized protein ATNIH1004_009180 [Aspergillus tanneri]|uniref:Uncharacterized protein n=1 Tax=Aspergillus tanneri TaxID=1220188 RepID=A0A5M9MKN4_9EURO|nr:uncharacterized protein ATNIH1004_009180 [Aspergillus tanneri]KAA8644969.1 hypothetical protein ATNIH1004_009180 [Aspergillus tanneri]